ncbi:MAG: hypothetical protein NZ529_01145 [Cytophagaceae bacterium]|nr:hypothetical protein [Cytophagaceae bacterium]MDW8455371.1 hypothetical protein [Cytophagaceae bacterium]
MQKRMPADFQSGSLEDTTLDFTPHPRINPPPTSLQNHRQTQCCTIGLSGFFDFLFCGAFSRIKKERTAKVRRAPEKEEQKFARIF